MNIEALLKLRCQQALAQGNYDSVKLYADQLSMHKDGCNSLPIIEEYTRLRIARDNLCAHDLSIERYVEELQNFYGNDLYSVCIDFTLQFGDSELVEYYYH